MKRIIAAAVLAASTIAAHAQSFFELEAGVGMTHYHTFDGRWYQQGMPGADNKLTNNTPEFSLGLTGPLFTRGRWGIDWHADYVNLGRAAASCNCTPRDENYDANRHLYTAHFNVDPAQFSGSGRSQGVAFTVEPYYWTHGVRIGVEAGAYVHRDSWLENVANWQVDRSVPKQTFDVGGAYWAVAPVVGVNIGNGRWTVSYRHYFMKANTQNRKFPPLWNDADVIEAKFKF